MAQWSPSVIGSMRGGERDWIRWITRMAQGLADRGPSLSSLSWSSLWSLSLPLRLPPILSLPCPLAPSPHLSLNEGASLIASLKRPCRSFEGAACSYVLWQDRRRETAGAAWQVVCLYIRRCLGCGCHRQQWCRYCYWPLALNPPLHPVVAAPSSSHHPRRLTEWGWDSSAPPASHGWYSHHPVAWPDLSETGHAELQMDPEKDRERNRASNQASL